MRICNLSDVPITIPQKSIVGTAFPVFDSKHKEVCNINPNHDRIQNETLDESLNQMINPHLSTSQRKAVSELIKKHNRVFANTSNPIGLCRLPSADCSFPLKQKAAPHHRPMYRFSPKDREILMAELLEFKQNGIIEPSTSPWAAPVMLVKREGKVRVVVDLRGLNERVESDQYPLPRADEVLRHLTGHRWFSTVDLNKGFYQIPILDPRERAKTAFRTPFGLHQFTRLPQGYKNSPAIFQRIMDGLFATLKWECVLIYIDDIIVFSPDFNTHLSHLDQVLSLLVEAGFTVSPNKCNLFRTEIDVLGHRITPEGLATNLTKTLPIQSWSTPTSKEELASFHGFASYYRKFISNFSQIAHPLIHLLKPDSKFDWTPDCDSAFLRLKTALCNSPVLATFNENLATRICTDASSKGLGAVLEQQQSNGDWKPIIFISRSLSPAETRYGATELECLGIHWAIQRLRPYIEGLKFDLITDHAALQWLFSKEQDHPNRRLSRWISDLAPYNDYFTVKHRAGASNVVADALSRYPEKSINLISLNVDFPTLDINPDSYTTHPTFNNILNSLRSGEETYIQQFKIGSNGLLYLVAPDKEPRLCIPTRDLQSQLLHFYHASPLANHLGFDKCLYRITQHYYWKGLAKDLRQFIRSCDICQHIKTATHAQNPLLTTKISLKPFEVISIDFVSLPRAKCKHDTVMVVTDFLTKRALFIPTVKTATASDIADLFFTNVFRHHGLPKRIISDRDPKFTSHFWKSLLTRLGIRANMSTSDHPQTDGHTERLIRSLQSMLRAFVSERPSTWPHYLHLVEFNYNNSTHATTQHSPFHLLYGHHPTLPNLLPSSPLSNDLANDYLSLLQHITSPDFLQRLHNARQEAFDNIVTKRTDDTRSSMNRTATRFAVDDYVLIRAEYLLPESKRLVTSKKLLPRYIGPYRVSKIINQNAYQIELPQHFRVHNTVNIKNLKRYYSDNIPAETIKTQSRTNIVNELFNPQLIESIVDHMTINSQPHYLVKWKNAPPHESSWIPASILQDNQHLMDYLTVLDYLSSAESSHSEPAGDVTTRRVLRPRPTPR